MDTDEEKRTGEVPTLGLLICLFIAQGDTCFNQKDIVAGRMSEVFPFLKYGPSTSQILSAIQVVLLGPYSRKVLARA